MQVVTAALIEKNGRILLARRKAGKHMGAKWEFPGGKVEPGRVLELDLVESDRELARRCLHLP
jgi:8-oxo-dGTP diphosphatase